jgi:hypothetical protein
MNTENSCCEARITRAKAVKEFFDMNSENDWRELLRHFSRKVAI